MNKAFVREDANDEDDDPPEAPDAAGPAPRNYITPAGHARMKTELLHLLDVERPEVVRVVSWAASNGDRSENGDYLYGKKRLREIDRRIRFSRSGSTVPRWWTRSSTPATTRSSSARP